MTMRRAIKTIEACGHTIKIRDWGKTSGAPHRVSIELDGVGLLVMDHDALPALQSLATNLAYALRAPERRKDIGLRKPRNKRAMRYLDAYQRAIEAVERNEEVDPATVQEVDDAWEAMSYEERDRAADWPRAEYLVPFRTHQGRTGGAAMRTVYVLDEGDGEPFELESLHEFLRANPDMDDLDVIALRALMPGQSFSGGGGAWAEWTVRCEERP
jgi:hypothetical protein